MKVVAIIRKVYAALYILNTLLGIIGMLAISMFDNHRFGRFTIVGPLVTLVICAIPMLILLIFIGIGRVIYMFCFLNLCGGNTFTLNFLFNSF